MIVKQAVKDGYLEKDPFAHVDLGIRPTKGKRVFLEIEEITKLKNAKVPAGRQDLAEARDHWLFCFYASFYYSDLRGLKWVDVKNTEFGYCIIGERYKNESSFIAPVHKFTHAVHILERQKAKIPTWYFLMPLLNRNSNSKLKDLASLAGINKNLMNKSARHSAIQFWESQGLETQHMAKMAGHTQESTTKEYYDLSARDINNRVARFDFAKFDI
ncbi:MAG: tyrosine-type recombinase/integrase [Bacteroidota bacterium]